MGSIGIFFIIMELMWSNEIQIYFRGFGGDTMHMARLFNPSLGPKSYSLSGLTK